MAYRLQFGTDGVRGEFNVSLMVEDALSLGRAAGTVLDATDWHIGRDTRISGDPLSAAFTAGLQAVGRRVSDLGVVPSGAVAHMSAVRSQPGVMITASHNPYQDNGIKIFSPGGGKVSEDVERRIEAEVDRLSKVPAAEREVAETIGHAGRATQDEQTLYPEFVLRQLGDRSYRSFRLAVDCANGSACVLGPQLLRAAGAEVVPLAHEPDGFNINADSGSTHIGFLQDEVRSSRFSAGLAFDGDADRLLVVDEKGDLVDGDQIMAVIALAWSRSGRLRGNGLVATSWSNLGLRVGMASAGIGFAESDVGDKYVAAEMTRQGFALGGEQSGHIIFKDLLPVGDGLLTAFEFLNVLHDDGRTLSAVVASAMEKLPQAKKDLRVEVEPRTLVEELEAYRRSVNEELGSDGRLVLRASGTENVVRVMAEALTVDGAESLVADTTGQVRTVERSVLGSRAHE